jgi:hypothetical protein
VRLRPGVVAAGRHPPHTGGGAWTERALTRAAGPSARACWPPWPAGAAAGRATRACASAPTTAWCWRAARPRRPDSRSCPAARAARASRPRAGREVWLLKLSVVVVLLKCNNLKMLLLRRWRG